MKAYLSPYWNVRLGYGRRIGSIHREPPASSPEQAVLSKELPFNDLVFQMLPYGVNVPLVTQGAQNLEYHRSRHDPAGAQWQGDPEGGCKCGGEPGAPR